MKARKFLYILLAGMMTTLGFTACNDDDNGYKVPTELEKMNAFAPYQGLHTGRLVFQKNFVPGAYEQPKETVSLPISWNMESLTTMTIYDFPVEALTEYMRDGEMKTAMLAQIPQNLACTTDIMSVSPMTFLVNPSYMTFNLAYGETSHTVKIAFYVNSTNSYGICSDQNVAVQIVLAAVYVDEQVKQDFFYTQYQAIPFVLTTKPEESDK